MRAAGKGRTLSEDGLSVIVESVEDIRFDSLNTRQVQHAAMVIADTVGVMMSGVPKSGLIRGDGTVADRFGILADETGGAEVAGTTIKMNDLEQVALINATGGTFIELDEGQWPTGHPAIQIVPAAFAVSQRLGCSGRDLLTAVVAGYQVAATLYRTYQLRPGIHPHGTFAAVGAAVAVARLLGDDEHEPALLAGNLTLAPSFETCFEGATVRNAYAGVAAAQGVRANRLAHMGIRGSLDAFNTTFGEVLATAPTTGQISDSVDALWIEKNYFKFHSCCGLALSAVDSVLGLAPLDPSQITNVVVETTKRGLSLNRLPHRNSLSTRFSIPYAVASALINRHAQPDAFNYVDSVAELARKVTVVENSAIEVDSPKSWFAKVTVNASNQSESLLVLNHFGHPDNPADLGDLREKFAGLIAVPNANERFDQLLAIADLKSCHGLLQVTGATDV